MSKTFTIAGVSRRNGELKLRFANDVLRVKHLHRLGHADILMIELPNAMTTDEAVAYIAPLPEFGCSEIQALIVQAQTPPEPKVKKAKKPKDVVIDEPIAQAEPEPEAEPVNDEVTAEISQLLALEDEPF
jgi:hypothetical protein